MMSKLRKQSAHKLVFFELPPLVAALLVAEILFRFGDFLLEAAAFLAVWYCLDGLYERARAIATHRTARVRTHGTNSASA